MDSTTLPDSRSTVSFASSTNYGLQLGSARDVYYNHSLPVQPKSKPKPTTTVPFGRDKDFVQRKEFDIILDKCKLPFARFGLVGLGGMGKSQLAIEFSWRIRETSPDTWVFWVHASNSARLLESYKKIAERMDIPGNDDANKDIFHLVGSWLGREENGKWVVIVDNADDIDVLKKLSQDSLPEVEHGRILITSRSKDAAYLLVGNYQNIVEIGTMSSEDAKALFRTKCHHEQKEDELTELVLQLEHVPLAITQSASFIQKGYPRMTISKYLDRFNRTESDVVEWLSRAIPDRRRDQAATNSIILTWKISFDQIQSKAPHAADLLSFMSLCDRQGIPEMLLSEGLKTAGSHHSLDINLEILQDYSLITVDLSGEVFGMHRLVQLTTRAWLEQSLKYEHWKDTYIQTIAAVFPSGHYETWQACSTLFAHAQLLLKYSSTQDDPLLSRADALARIGWYSLKRGQYVLAKICYDEARADKEKVLGKDHPHTLNIMNDLVFLLRIQDKYTEAERLIRQVLAGRVRVLGKDHPDTLTSKDNLADLLCDQEKYDEGERLHREALEGYEKVVGKDHLHTLISMDNLAIVLTRQKKHKEAEGFARQALSGYQRVVGKDSPYTLNSMDTLAVVLDYQGKHKEAKGFVRQSLAGHQRTVGIDHPDTLTNMDNLATILLHQGKYEEAEGFTRRALAGREKLFGKDHPDTLTSMNTLAQVLFYQGKHEEAEGLTRQALTGREKLFGRDHSDIVPSTSGSKRVQQFHKSETNKKGRYMEP